jgi:hypothetical protein
METELQLRCSRDDINMGALAGWKILCDEEGIHVIILKKEVYKGRRKTNKIPETINLTYTIFSFAYQRSKMLCIA